MRKGNSNSLGRELDNVLNGPECPQDSESVPHRKNCSQENEIRDIYSGNDTAGRDRLTDSFEILSGEMSARLSQEMY